MVSGKVKKASIRNTATGGTSDVTFAMGSPLAGYTLGWVPLGVVPTAVDSSGVAEYHLLIQWAGGREYDDCRVRVTMNGAAPDTPGYVLAPLSQVDGAADMGLGVMRTPATGTNEGVWA